LSIERLFHIFNEGNDPALEGGFAVFFEKIESLRGDFAVKEGTLFGGEGRIADFIAGLANQAGEWTQLGVEESREVIADFGGKSGGARGGNGNDKILDAMEGGSDKIAIIGVIDAVDGNFTQAAIFDNPLVDLGVVGGGEDEGGVFEEGFSIGMGDMGDDGGHVGGEGWGKDAEVANARGEKSGGFAGGDGSPADDKGFVQSKVEKEGIEGKHIYNCNGGLNLRTGWG
jgi:hypothetical protein